MPSIIRSTLLALSFFLSLAQAAPLLQIQNGLLHGASNVQVLGASYDVEFIDGSCFSVFSGCYESSFGFTTRAGALAATNALFDQVLLDGLSGAFDTNAQLTNGCLLGPGEANDICSILTPWAITDATLAGGPRQVLMSFVVGFNNSAVLSNPSTGDDSTDTQATSGLTDLTNRGSVFARWASADIPVPLPASLPLLLLGLGVLAIGRRFQK
jgi:hypothetical protein